MNVASIHKGLIRRILLSILAAVLVLSGVSANSFAYVYTIQGPIIEFIEMDSSAEDSEADFDYTSTSNGFIYFNEIIIEDNGTISNDGKTLTWGIPPEYSVSSFMGYLKGKSALMMFVNMRI